MDGERQTYDGKIHQLVTFAVLLVGKNTVFKFPRLLFIHGGVPFLFAYTTFMVTIVMPIMHLENTLGQFSGLGHLGIFDTVPVFRGLGYTMTYYFALEMVVFSTESSYGSVFLVNWFQSPLPWASCLEPWVQEPDHCYVQNKDVVLCSSLRQKLLRQFRGPDNQEGIPVTNGNETAYVPEEAYTNFTAEYCINGTLPSVHLFVKNQVLRLDFNQWDFLDVHPDLAVSTALLWLIIFTVARHGIHRAKYTFFVIGTISSLSLTLILSCSLTLEDTGLGRQFLFRNTIIGLTNPTMWRDALKISISNISLLGCSFLNAVRYNTFKNDFRYDILTVIIMELAANIICGLLLSAFVGYLASVRGVNVDDVFNPNCDLQHEIIPEALTVIDPSGSWCLVYFVLVITNALGYMMMGPEVLLETLFYDSPNMSSARTECTFFACGAFYLLGLASTTQGGLTLARLASHQMELLGTIIMLMELSAFLKLYGVPRLLIDYYTMVDEYPTDLIRISWAAVAPILLFILLGVELYFFIEVQEKDGQQSSWHCLLGPWILLMGTSFTLTYAFACLTRFYLVWQEVVSPLGTWKPQSLYDSRRYRRLLRQFSLLSKRRGNSGSSSTAHSRTSGQGETAFDNSERREGIGSERSVSFAPDLPAPFRFRPGAFNETLARRFGLTIPPRPPGVKRAYPSQEDLLQELASPPSDEEEEKPLPRDGPEAELEHVPEESAVTPPVFVANKPVVPFKMEQLAVRKKKKGKRKKRRNKKPKPVVISSLDGDLSLVNRAAIASDEKYAGQTPTTSAVLDGRRNEHLGSHEGTKARSSDGAIFSYPLAVSGGRENPDEKDVAVQRVKPCSVDSRALVPWKENPIRQYH